MVLCGPLPGVGSRIEGRYARGLADSSRVHSGNPQAVLTSGSRRSTCRLRSEALGQRLVLKCPPGVGSSSFPSQHDDFWSEGSRGIVCLFAFAKKISTKKKPEKRTEEASAEAPEKKSSAKSDSVASAVAATATATATAPATATATATASATATATAAAAATGLAPDTEAAGVAEAAASAKPTIRVGWHAEQGLREEMEDDIVVQKDAFGGYLYGAVFDGHVGKSTVQFLKEELFAECVEHLEGGKKLDSKDLADATRALEAAFARTDERLLEWLEQHSEEPDSGSTATAVFARDDRLFVAHLGDSRAVLAQGGDSEELSEDHRPHGGSDMAVAETQRIKDAGGWVSQGRVCGMLAVSRAFGNRSLKTGRERFLQEGIKKGRWTTRFVNKLRLDSAWVSVVPDVYATEVGDETEFVLVASDGMWDAVRSSEAVRFVRNRLLEHDDAQRACEELVAFALKERKADDNISALLIQFRQLQ